MCRDNFPPGRHHRALRRAVAACVICACFVLFARVCATCNLEGFLVGAIPEAFVALHECGCSAALQLEAPLTKQTIDMLTLHTGARGRKSTKSVWTKIYLVRTYNGYHVKSNH